MDAPTVPPPAAPPSNERLPRVVVCAAMRNAAGRIVCGARHRDPIMRAQVEAAEGSKAWLGAEQGFIDNRGEFLTREEAHEIAWEQKQVRRRCGGDQKKLYSENLY